MIAVHFVFTLGQSLWLYDAAEPKQQQQLIPIIKH